MNAKGRVAVIVMLDGRCSAGGGNGGEENGARRIYELRKKAIGI